MSDHAYLVVLLIIQILATCTLLITLYQLLKQQGRILLRLDELDQRAAFRVTENLMLSNLELETLGFNLGQSLPALCFLREDGQAVTLNEFKGTRSLFVHWNTVCPFCGSIAQDLTLLQDAFSKAAVELVILTRDEPSAVRKQIPQLGTSAPILVANETESVEFLGRLGTPVAYLIDAEGRLANRPVIGSDAVLTLARRVVQKIEKKRLPGERPLSESRIERNGLKAGAVAPEFSLPDLDNRPVSLTDYRGRKVLLVFTDPHCKPCDQIAAELVNLHQRLERNGLALIVVGRGDVEDNRRKVEENQFGFPVIVQKKWELSKLYGIFATPVAFLIDAQGVITRDVAVGVDAIRELAYQALDTPQTLINRTVGVTA